MYASAAAPGRVRRKSGLEDPRPETQERRAKGWWRVAGKRL
jgi:hypothetical protein